MCDIKSAFCHVTYCKPLLLFSPTYSGTYLLHISNFVLYAVSILLFVQVVYLYLVTFKQKEVNFLVPVGMLLLPKE